MGADQSSEQPDREYARLVAEQEQQRHAREQQLQEALRLERIKNQRLQRLKELEDRQLQEALRRSTVETRNQLYPNLSTGGTSTYQTTQNFVVNREPLRYQPSAPPAHLSPTVRKPLESRPRPSPRPPIIFKPATVTGAAAPHATTSTVRASATAPQAATVHASALAPQAGIVRASVTAPPVAHTSAAVPNEKQVFTRRVDDCMLCKTCKKPYEEKIFQCKNGHSSCEGCWSLDVACGLCRGPITNTRNFDLENYIKANSRVKCPNAGEGCILSVKQSELIEHGKVCPFKEIKCPALENCNWKGKISQLSIHFEQKHPTSGQGDVDTEMFLPIMCNEYKSLKLIKLGNFNFLFYVQLSETENRVYMAIQLIGSKAGASKWNYEIHVYNKRQPRRKYQYEDCCNSFEETPVSFSRCAILPLTYARSFANEGNLAYKFFIKKTFKGKRN